MRPHDLAPPTASSGSLFTLPFVLLLIVQFAYGTAFSTFFVLPKYLLQHLNASAILVGNAQGAFAIAGALSVPVVGMAIDRCGRKVVLVLGLGLGILSFAPFGWVNSSASVLALRALHGVSFCMTFAAGGTLAIDLAPLARRAEAVGYFGTAMLLTNAFGAAVGEWIETNSSWTLVFIACSAYSAVALGFASCIRAPRFSKRRRFRIPFTRSLAGAYLASVALGVGVGTSETFIPAAMLQEGAGWVGSFFFAYTLGAIAQRTFLGFLPDRLGRLRATVISLASYGAALGIVASSSLDWTVLLAALIGAAHGLAYPASAALSVDLCPSDARGTVTTVVAGCFNLGFGFGPTFLAPLEPSLGYRGITGLAAASIALSAPCVLWLVTSTPRTSGTQRRFNAPSDAG